MPNKQWEYVDKYIFSGVDLNGTPKVFNNLEGDKYDYQPYVVVDNLAAQSLQMLCNADSGANYRNYESYGTNATTAGTVADADSLVDILTCDTTANYRHLCLMTILGDSSGERVIDCYTSGYSTNSFVYKRSSYWSNTADELTSLTFQMSTADVATGEIYLFRRQKESVYNSADWELIEEKEFATADLNASPLTFNNLQGDKDKEYHWEVEIDSIDSVTTNFLLWFRCNNDSGANYTRQDLFNNAGTLTAQNDTTQTGIQLTETMAAATIKGFNSGRINAESGIYRVAFSNISKAQATFTRQRLRGTWWRNSADEITSLVLEESYGGATATGRARLYKCSKKRSTSSHERLIYDYDVSGDFSAGQEFLNLDTNKMYRVDCSMDSGFDTYFRTRFNGDTGANYFVQSLYATGVIVGAGAGAGTSQVMGISDGNIPNLSTMLLFPQSGKYRPSLVCIGGKVGVTPYVFLRANWWMNTADDIQDMLIYADVATVMTGNIKIWEINLP